MGCRSVSLVKIERAGDLIYWSYHMVDWTKIQQSCSSQKCVQCGGPMMKVEQVEDAKGSRYDGIVCHACKRVIWAKRT
jgi:uncharacterized protein with PIN domain